MTILLPFANNVTIELFDEAQSLVVGYMFASSSERVAQEQRWVLYPEYTSPPTQAVVFRAPLKPGLQFSTVDAFLEAVCVTGTLWRTAARYVKVVTQTYDSVPTTMPDPLPFPALTFDNPSMAVASWDSDTHPGRGKGNAWGRGHTKDGVQIDDSPAKLSSMPDGSITQAYVFGTAIKESTIPGVFQNNEYWVTLSGFAPANTSTSLFLRKDTDREHETLSTFYDAMRRLEGGKLTVASCVYSGQIPTNP
jgi:hypothetical protein